MTGNSPTRYAAVAVLAAVMTIVLKTAGYWLTGSVAILSDALESFVNLATSLIALVVLMIASRPADEDHAYGHTKVEYFASGFEGAMILFAALTIAWAAAIRLLNPVPLTSVRSGLAFTVLATIVNLVAAGILSRAGKRLDSIALSAGAEHLMVDVWTSVAVIAGVGLAAATGIPRLDPVIAMVVAVNIVRTGVILIRRSMLGLIDTALPEDVRVRIAEVLETSRPPGTHYHAIRTRQAGSWRFISFHMLVPGSWSVQEGHDLLETVEDRIRCAVPNCTVFTHLEPIEDPLSFEDTGLRRGG
ncbi:MAG: cation diffusion facilitator family transporter [Gemmatimonadota bacterium]|jgi:cation diffusion facilitator family transporter|nr:cation diffusion facilitator family transporter [Gemmatimonadota bacterium]